LIAAICIVCISATRLAALERERFTDPAAGLEIGTVKESLASLREQLAKKRPKRKTAEPATAAA
jgi:hypothetical protein